MEFHALTTSQARKAPLLVLPVVEGEKQGEWAATCPFEKEEFSYPIKLGDFKGKQGEIAYIYLDDKILKRVILIGLGKSNDLDVEILRRVYGKLIKTCHKNRWSDLAIVFPTVKLNEEDTCLGVFEGMLLANYTFDRYKTGRETKESKRRIQSIGLIDAPKLAFDIAKRCQAITEGVYLARDLINENADVVTPSFLAKTAKELSQEFPKLSLILLDKKRLIKEKLNLLTAVGKGSSQDPLLILLEYKGAPKNKEKIALIGKGVTFDSGGINLKPSSSGSLEIMRSDMSGAAAVLGTLKAVAILGLKLNVIGVIPTTENMLSATSFKPGDVYQSLAGKTVEIGNTDAEGRLILADAISYAKKMYHPTRIIDIATLTGAMVIALGGEAIGMMSNNDELASQMIEAGGKTFERVWRFPLFKEYREQLKSDIADIKNVGGREGAAIIAAKFLEEFVEETPWAHLDIAGTAFSKNDKDYTPKNGVGVGVRLFIEYLRKDLMK